MQTRLLQLFQCFATISVALLTLSACSSSTSLSSSWVNNDYKGAQFKRVLVVAITPSPDRRMSFEDAIVYDLRSDSTIAWPSSRLMNPEEEITKESLRKVVNQQEADAIVVSRVTDISIEQIEQEGRSRVQEEVQQSGQPNVWERQQGTIFRYDFTEEMEPATITTRFTTELTTDVYAADSGEAVYSIVSTSSGQETLNEVVEILSDEIAKRLHRDRVISK